MWECECGLRFKDPDIVIGNIELCPLCGSENIFEIEDIVGSEEQEKRIAKMKNDLDKIDNILDSFGIIEQDYKDADLEMPELWTFTPLSFDDLEANEICLIDLGLPSGHTTSLEDSVPAITYYREMNSRFLRTFLGEPVWA